MARSAAISIENNFTKGLVTEASGLNFPENACTEIYDCILSQNGTVTRRLGMDYEDNYDLVNVTDVTDCAVGEYVWEGVGNSGTITFVVQQVGETLYFFEVSQTTGLSDSRKAFTVDLTSFGVSGAPALAPVLCQFAAGNGDLFVTHPYCTPFYIEYNRDADSISTNSIDIQIRDFAGVDDGLDVETRPTTLSNQHKYNLYNQGWYATAKDDGNNQVQVLTEWDGNRTDYPSNVDIWWLYKNSDNQIDFSGDGTRVNTIHFGNTPAPKGHYLLDAFYMDRSSASGVTNITVESASYYRPLATAFYAGRVFYGGTAYKEWSNRIYFSQIIESREQYGKCYQLNDPTSENISDLLSSDGGVVVIPDLGLLRKLVPFGTFLLAFSSNGIWAIGGNQGSGFTANDYSVQKVSSISSLSALSFLEVDGAIMWWNPEGVYVLQPDPVKGGMSVQSLTDQSIRSFIRAIPAGNLEYVKGAYNSQSKTAQWVFRSTAASTTAENFEYDRVLNFLTLTQAFFPWRIQEVASGPYVAGVVATKGFGITRETGNVIDGDGDTVIDGSSNNVVVTAVSQAGLTASFRYTTIVPDTSDSITYSQESDTGFVDWFTFNGEGEAYESYFITGYKVHGEGLKKFQGNWLTVFSEVESDSKAYVQYVWDYASSNAGGKYSVAENVYLTRSHVSITPRRLKLRGRGIVLQLKFYSSTGKPFNIIGWSMFETGNQAP